MNLANAPADIVVHALRKGDEEVNFVPSGDDKVAIYWYERRFGKWAPTRAEAYSVEEGRDIYKDYVKQGFVVPPPLAPISEFAADKQADWASDIDVTE